MITPMHILATPLLLILRALDLYVCLAIVRLVLAHVDRPKAREALQWLRPVTDWPPERVSQWLASHNTHGSPAWLPWAMVIGGCIVTATFLSSVLSVM